MSANPDIGQLIDTSNAALQGTGTVDGPVTEGYETTAGGFAAGEDAGHAPESSDPQPPPPVEIPTEQLQGETLLGGPQQPEPEAAPDETTASDGGESEWEVKVKGLQSALSAERELRQTAQQRIEEMTEGWQKDRHFRETYEPHIAELKDLYQGVTSQAQALAAAEQAKAEAEAWRDFYKQQLASSEVDLSDLERGFRQERQFARMESFMQSYPEVIGQQLSRMMDERDSQPPQGYDDRRAAWEREQTEGKNKLITDKLKSLYNEHPDLEEFNDYFQMKLEQDPQRPMEDLAVPFLVKQAKRQAVEGSQRSISVPGSAPSVQGSPSSGPAFTNMGIDAITEALRRQGMR